MNYVRTVWYMDRMCWTSTCLALTYALQLLVTAKGYFIIFFLLTQLFRFFHVVHTFTVDPREQKTVMWVIKWWIAYLQWTRNKNEKLSTCSLMEENNWLQLMNVFERGTRVIWMQNYTRITKKNNSMVDNVIFGC